MRHTPCGYSPPKLNFGYVCRDRCGHRPFCPVSPECRWYGEAAAVASQTHFFCLARKSGQKEALRCGSDCTAVPQNEPIEGHCGQHTGVSLQSCTTAPPAWNNAPIDSSCYARGWQNTLPCNSEHIYVFADGAQYLRSIVNVCRGRCPHRPLQHAVQNRNKPSIPEMSRTEIIAGCPQMRVVHLPELKAIGEVTNLRPNRASKKSRAAARNIKTELQTSEAFAIRRGRAA